MSSLDRCAGKEDLVGPGLVAGWGLWIGNWVGGNRPPNSPPTLLGPHFININTESSLSKWLDSLILLEGEVLYSLNGFY